MNLLLQQLANGMVLGAAYVLVALGLYLVFSTLHLPNFAHGEMFALGAYVQYALVVGAGIPFVLAGLVTVVIVSLWSVVLELLVFRRLYRFSTTSVLVGSLALAIVLQEIIGVVWGGDPLSVPTPLGGITEIGSVRIATYRLAIVGIVVAAVAVVAVIVYRTDFGRAMRAVAQNKEIAQLSGIAVPRISKLTFALSGAMAALAGVLLAPTMSLNPHMGFHPTLVAFSVLVIAGAGGRLSSVAVGGFLVAILETLAAGYIANNLRTVVVFAALVVFLSIKPRGFFHQADFREARL